MEIREFSFNLPEHLIAQYPSDRRGTSRLLVLDRSDGSLEDSTVNDLASFLPEDSVLVVNNSKVRKARVYGTTEYGGNVEFLFLNQIDSLTWLVMTSKSKRQHVGRRFTFTEEGTVTGTIMETRDDTKVLQTNIPLDDTFFDSVGHIPLPPYIKRDDEFLDTSRYQTIYADTSGSVAAPTAGLHFTQEILETIRARNISIAPVTLHVGPGTFLPVRSRHLEDHTMHTEHYEISSESAECINRAKREGRKIIAVGTTSVRTLESAYSLERNEVVAGTASTNLFITPDFTFHVVDHLMTNFHTPESTLLVLVSSFATKEQIEQAYTHAVNSEYRFFSYGDAMLIL
ncbi:MAG: tRNA preQ1(34) S-adenosylmethionine ribosyltransferase-isomerase QueA [Sphaerochaetaceae bacterium]|nr:tRNA preQ1(34) S-adenosylmethionine ribosyltransferase-isomerase QueA [Sphaerochaetaceae bacterium]